MGQISARTKIIWSLFLFTGLTVALFLTRSNYVSPAQLTLAIAIFVVGLLPIAWHLRFGGSSFYPLFPVLGLYYSISFGLPFLIIDFIWPTGFREISYFGPTNFPIKQGLASLESMWLVLAGMLTCFISFAAAQKPANKLIGEFQFPTAATPRVTRLLAYGLLLGFAANEFIPFLRKAPSLSQLFGRIEFVVFAVFFVAYQQRLIGKADAGMVFFGILPLLILYRTISGLYSPILMLCLLVCFLSWPKYKKQAATVAVISAIFLFLFYVPAQQYRAQTSLTEYISSSSKSNSTSIRNSLFFLKLSLSVWQGEETVTFEDQIYKLGPTHSLETIGRRIFIMPLFDHVHSLTPNTVPYWRGETYKPLLTKFIPRALWSDKPEERFGGEFALRFGLISVNDTTSINIPWIVELLANFGPTGVLGGMVIIGIFFALIDSFFNNRSTPPFERAIGLSIVFRLAYPESNFSLMCGDLLVLTIFVYVYFSLGFHWIPKLLKSINLQ